MKTRLLTLLAAAACSVGVAAAQDIETYSISTSHSWASMGLSSAANNGVLLAQTVTLDGGDAGVARMHNGSVRYQEYHNGTHVTEDIDVVAFIGDPASLGIDGEAGSFTSGASSHGHTVTVNLSGTYTDPVVFAQVRTQNGGDAFVIQATSVDLDSSPQTVTFKLDESATYDGAHTTETFHYVAVESGEHEMTDGRLLLAGSARASITNGVKSYPQIDLTRQFQGVPSIIARHQSEVTEYNGVRVTRDTDAFGDLTTINLTPLDLFSSAVIGYMVIGDPVDQGWTDWLDRDDPAGGDWEAVGAFFRDDLIPCLNPSRVQCRRVSDGMDASKTGENVTCNTERGFYCETGDQPDGACDDYEVRYACRNSAERSKGFCAYPGDVLLQSDQARLEFSAGGQLKLYDNDGTVQWQTYNGYGDKVCYQGSDGNLVIYSNTYGAMWSTGTHTTGPDRMRLDGCRFQLLDDATQQVNYEVGGHFCERTSTQSGFCLDGTSKVDAYLLNTDDGALVFDDGELRVESADGSSSATIESGFDELCFIDGRLHGTGGNGAAWIWQATGTNIQVVEMKMNACEVYLQEVWGDVSYEFESGLCNPDLSALCSGGFNPPSEVFMQTADWRDDDENFGASYLIAAGLINKDGLLDNPNLTAAEQASIQARSEDYLWLGGRADADALLFGYEATILKVEAKAEYEDDAFSSAVTLEVLGATLYDEPLEISVGWEQGVTFLEGTAQFGIFAVSAEMAGAIGFEGSASIDGLGLTVEVTPYAGVAASVNAGLGIVCASAGVAADLNILGIELPAEGQLGISGGDLPWTAQASLEITALDGSVYLYADVCGLYGAEYELFSWDGVDVANVDILDEEGCL